MGTPSSSLKAPPSNLPKGIAPYATLLLTEGVYPKVSKMLGYANISITLDTYSHVIPGMGDAAAGAADEVLA